MRHHGGFEGNAQTIRILTRLEKFTDGHGINPTRRLLLAVLKYPAAYSSYPDTAIRKKPPKCYYDSEDWLIQWALSVFPSVDVKRFLNERTDKPVHMTFDASIMELADDIAYGVHDLEDIAARRMTAYRDIEAHLKKVFVAQAPVGPQDGREVWLDDFRLLDGPGRERKKLVGKLVNLFVSTVQVEEQDNFSSPLLRYRARLPSEVSDLLQLLKTVTYDLVVSRAGVQQLESRGERIVRSVFEALMDSPSTLIPREAWESLPQDASEQRRVCDYVSGMTDPYCERIFCRLYQPGFGTSRDEL